MSACPDSDRLEQFLGDQLSAAEEATVAGHVESCPACQNRLEQLTQFVGPVASKIHQPAELPAAFVARLQVVSPLVGFSSTQRGMYSTRPTLESTSDEGRSADNWPVIHGYEVLGELGRGGMGVVYKARQRGLNRFVALKMILDGAHAGGEHRARFRREAEAVAQLQHPNIVQVYDIGEQEGRPFFSMEYVEGSSLARQLAGTPQTPHLAAELARTLALAVQAAHEHGIVHRDLKPANVLLQIADCRLPITEGRPAPADSQTSAFCNLQSAIPKITDFGLAKQAAAPEGESADQAVTRSGAIMGSPSYMAPEQAAGRGKTVGPAADVYALGAILYESVTGRPPFRGATALDTLMQVTRAEPIPPRRLVPTVPRDLETICLKCLEKSPPRRYATAEELANDLQRFLSGEPIRARRVRGWERGVKWTRRRPALASLIVVSILAGLSLSVFGVWHTQRLKEQKDRADYNLDESMAAIGRLVAHAEHLGRLGQPDADAAQRRILEEAIRSHESLLAHPDNSTPRARLRQSLTRFELGRFQTFLGQWDQAGAHFEEALAMQHALLRDYPREGTYRRHLGITTGYQALQWKTDYPKRAAGLVRGIQILREVLGQTPEDQEAKSELARIYHHLGQTYHAWRSQTTTADTSKQLLTQEEEAYREALELNEAVLQERPHQARSVYAITTTLSNLAVTLFARGEWEEARELLRRSARLLEDALAKGEQHPELVANLLSTYLNLGSRADVTGRHAEAQEWYSRVVKREETLVPTVPRHYRANLYVGHAGLAKSLVYLKRPTEAVPHWDRALELCPPEVRSTIRFYRTYTLGQTADHARASREALAMAEAEPANGGRLYSLAAVQAGALQAALQDAKLSTAERDALSERYAVTAVQLLEKARAAGLFNDPAQARRLEEDEDFVPLRSRKGFVQFLEGLKSGKELMP